MRQTLLPALALCIIALDRVNILLVRCYLLDRIPEFATGQCPGSYVSSQKETVLNQKRDRKATFTTLGWFGLWLSPIFCLMGYNKQRRPHLLLTATPLDQEPFCVLSSNVVVSTDTNTTRPLPQFSSCPVNTTCVLSPAVVNAPFGSKGLICSSPAARRINNMHTNPWCGLAPVAVFSPLRHVCGRQNFHLPGLWSVLMVSLEQWVLSAAVSPALPSLNEITYLPCIGRYASRNQR